MTVNVIAFGEGLLRLSPPQHQLLEQTKTLNWFVGGAEANVAVGLVRLGIETAWVSRLTSNPLGQYIVQTLRGLGVDTRPVVWTDADRVGLYFMEMVDYPREINVTYDRAGSAFAHMQPSDLALDALTVTGETWLHTTGITAALGEGARATAHALLAHVQAHGGKLSFDMNYRHKLWKPEEAVRFCEPFMQIATVIFIAERDVRTLYGLEGEGEALLRAFSWRYPRASIVMSRGAQGVMCATNPDTIYEKRAIFVPSVERIGAGDALATGFLSQYVRGSSIEDALKWGIATAALKLATLGDLPLIDATDIERWVKEWDYIDPDGRSYHVNR